MFIHETLETRVAAQCDVLVCGGGVAGISAALAAARQKRKVILLEREYMLGGLGTAGLITIYLPLCDGMGRQVSYGIAEELLRLSLSMGAEARYPDIWLDDGRKAERNETGKRFQVRYNAQLFAMLAEELLLREGVEILYGTHAAATAMDGDRIGAVIVENKSGRQAVRAASVVDATGDADIARFAGAPTEVFRAGNMLAAWYYFVQESGYDLRMLGALDVPESEHTAENAVEELVTERFTGLDGKEISRMMQLSHRMTLADVRKKREAHPETMPVTIATIPQVRMTRRLAGEYTLDECERHTRFADSVGMVSNWKVRGPVYEVPFGTLYSSRVRNLIVAGRCTSVTDEMWDVMRVIPCCAVTGQAAGTAAAMSDDFAALDVAKLQAALRAAGVVLHESEL